MKGVAKRGGGVCYDVGASASAMVEYEEKEGYATAVCVLERQFS